MMNPPMIYEEMPPPAELAPWVAAVWRFVVSPDEGEIQHHVPLTGGAILVSRAGDEPMFVAPRTLPLVVPLRGGEHFAGVHFWPGTIGSLLPDVARDAVGPARFLLGPRWIEAWSSNEAAETTEERFVGAVRHLVDGASPFDQQVMASVYRILSASGDVRVERLASAVALSPRQLRRRFQKATALSPKELIRICRVRASAASAVLAGEKWIELAATSGYADQAHLVREYRELLGLTPSSFAKHARKIEHRLLER